MGLLRHIPLHPVSPPEEKHRAHEQPGEATVYAAIKSATPGKVRAAASASGGSAHHTPGIRTYLDTHLPGAEATAFRGATSVARRNEPGVTGFVCKQKCHELADGHNPALAAVLRGAPRWEPNVLVAGHLAVGAFEGHTPDSHGART